MVRRRYREASSDMMRDQFAQFMTVKPCSTCHGTRCAMKPWPLRSAASTLPN